MKVVIPVAGFGSRLKPHTFTTPKPLMEVAGKVILDYVLEDVIKLNPSEIILVVGYKKDKVINYVKSNYKDLNFKFVEQKVLDGDGSAIRIGLNEIEDTENKKDEELYVIFGADTLIDFNIKKNLSNKNVDAIIFTKDVEEPQHYGVVNVDSENRILSVDEKPEVPKSNLAIIGAYYFKSFRKIKEMLNYFYEKKITVKDEYKLISVIEKLIEDKSKNVISSKVDAWYDCGRVQVMFDANKYFLERKSVSKNIIKRGSSIIIPPVYISKSAKIQNSVIGPFVSIGDNVEINSSIVKNSIINYDVKLNDLLISNSMIGKEAEVTGRFNKLNVGSKSSIDFN